MNLVGISFGFRLGVALTAVPALYLFGGAVVMVAVLTLLGVLVMLTLPERPDPRRSDCFA